MLAVGVTNLCLYLVMTSFGVLARSVSGLDFAGNFMAR